MAGLDPADARVAAAMIYELAGRLRGSQAEGALKAARLLDPEHTDEGNYPQDVNCAHGLSFFDRACGHCDANASVGHVADLRAYRSPSTQRIWVRCAQCRLFPSHYGHTGRNA